MPEQECIFKYELIDISFDQGYELPEDDVVWRVSEDAPSRNDEHKYIEYDADGIPMGRSKQEIKIREKMIKDFYAKWIAEHPDKAIMNKWLKNNILVKYQSINETYSKASRTYNSTLAVFQLTEILENAELVDEVIPKNNKNQKQYDKILYMKYKNIKLTVGLQRTNKDYVQYCITVPQQ